MRESKTEIIGREDELKLKWTRNLFSLWSTVVDHKPRLNLQSNTEKQH